MRNILKLIFLSSVVFCFSANANIIVKLTGPNGQDLCSSLPGSAWTGTGDVKTFLGDCNYNGTGQISGSASQLQVAMNLSKQSGLSLCPSNENKTLSATCVNNTLSINDQDVDISGPVTNNGKRLDADGSITVDGIKADLSVALNRSN